MLFRSQYKLFFNIIDKLILVYDASGNVKYRYRYAGNSTSTLQITGTYNVQSNCEAQVTYTNGRTATYFVDPKGDSLSFVITSGPIISSVATRVSQNKLLH